MLDIADLASDPGTPAVATGDADSAASGERRRLRRTRPARPSAIRLVEDVAPADLPSELVSLAEHAAGCRVALYVVDIGGSTLRLLAGARDWPNQIEIRQAIGPELPRGRMGDVQIDVEQLIKGAVAVPLWLHGRAVAVLVTERRPDHTLEPLARQAAVAIELAARYTDVFAQARRLRPTTAAAEIQENLLPPRMLQLPGVQIAGGVVPAYDVGGDWFDYAANEDGVWLAVGDAVGKGPTAAGASTVALGALRAARRAGEDLLGCARAVDAAVKELPDAGAFVTSILAHFDTATGQATWMRFGHPLPLLVTADGELYELPLEGHLPLGLLDDRDLAAQTITLGRDERLLLTSDGVWERRSADGGRFELPGIRRAVTEALDNTPAGIASALARAVINASPEDPRDDATVLVLGRSSG